MNGIPGFGNIKGDGSTDSMLPSNSVGTTYVMSDKEMLETRGPGMINGILYDSELYEMALLTGMIGDLSEKIEKSIFYGGTSKKIGTEQYSSSQRDLLSKAQRLESTLENLRRRNIGNISDQAPMRRR